MNYEEYRKIVNVIEHQPHQQHQQLPTTTITATTASQLTTDTNTNKTTARKHEQNTVIDQRKNNHLTRKYSQFNREESVTTAIGVTNFRYNNHCNRNNNYSISNNTNHYKHKKNIQFVNNKSRKLVKFICSSNYNNNSNNNNKNNNKKKRNNKQRLLSRNILNCNNRCVCGWANQLKFAYARRRIDKNAATKKSKIKAPSILIGVNKRAGSRSLRPFRLSKVRGVWRSDSRSQRGRPGHRVDNNSPESKVEGEDWALCAMGGDGKNSRRGLEPLEFEECIVDSPEFRDNLNRHEKELDHTSHQIKRIIKEVKDLMSATKVLSTRMKQLAYSLKDFNFECIGTAQTDDELVICESLKHFGDIISMIEDEREKMLTLADKHIIEPLEDFRKKQIGGVKENKKKFDKKTEKFCQSQERFLNMSTKKPENTIQEADASLGMHEREYIQESLSYVLRIQEVQERIKFEFVEILLAFISSWLVFYHTAHEQAEDNRDYLQDLRHKVQKTRENFEEAREKVTELKLKYMEKRTKPEEKFTKRGYLFLMEKKPFKATWTKYYCTYRKQKKEFTMLQFNQMNHSFIRPEPRDEEKVTLVSCQRRASEFEKRFCFDLVFKEKPGILYTFQALSEEDRRAWINAMDGAEPTYLASGGKAKANDEYKLDDVGFVFVRKCIQVLESRGLEDEGIYRKSGVGTKINKLLALGMDRKKTENIFSDEQYRDLMESNTIASALKTYLRNLNEPLMTYKHHNDFIEAAKQETLSQRVNEVHKLVYKLPQKNFEMLDIVIKHLTEVSRKYEKNKMSVFNLGVVFGPTLLRPQEETVAAILDIKFNNIVINILIENYERIFRNDPNSLDTFVVQSKHISSPPVRIPRSNQANKALGISYSSTGVVSSGNSNHVVGGGISGSGGGGHGSSGPSTVSRNSIYSTPSQQQQVYRIMNKASNFDSSISSSLQNIPNGLVYVHGGAVTTSILTGGGGGIGSSNIGSGVGSGVPIISSSNPPNGNLLNSHITNGSSSGSKSLGLSVNMGSVKNLHSMSQSDVNLRRAGGTDSVYNILSGNGRNGGFTAHHATPVKATTSLRHDYLLTNTSGTSSLPSSATAVAVTSNNISTTANRISHQTTISPPTLAMRKEALYGAGNGPQQHPPVQLQRSNHLPYIQTKHYSSVAAASTSSSNESVCDSISSTNGGGLMSGICSSSSNNGGVNSTSLGGNSFLSARSALDYTGHSTQNMNSLVTLPSSSCDDIVTSGITPSSLLLTSSSNISNITPPNEYIPHKMHRSKDLQQIKRDLDAGSARVRTLYACLGESEGELSFEPNQIITNVGFSHEPGWLQGTLNGKTGLIPENYVEHLKPYH